MPGSLENKVALVTGGGSGIGRATSLAFSREGAKVMVADVNSAAGEDTVSAIKEAGAESAFVHVDVASATSVQAMISRVVETYGRLDCAHNNAGIEGDFTARLHEYTEEIWDRLMDINLKGVWLCLKYEIQHMLEQGGGSIVNTASVAGLVGSRMVGPYTASKHGVVGLTKAAALEYAREGIRVNAVCPGVIDTPMVQRLIEGREGYEETISSRQPIGGLGKPEEIAEAVVWLSSDAASFITGHAMAVDGAFTAQ